MRFQHVYRLDRVRVTALAVAYLDQIGRVVDHVREKVRITLKHTINYDFNLSFF